MPWKGASLMDLRRQFLETRQKGLYTLTELCERFGISRKTGYKWLERHRTEGDKGLLDRSRRPHSCPWQMAPALAEELLAFRRAHPDWGPEKLLDLYSNQHPGLALPSISRVANLFHRHGLISPKRRRRSWDHPGKPTLLPTGPNELWTADFKGQFRTQNGVYCFPLTIVDRFSRKILACQALPSTRTALARPVFERLFREQGLPAAIRTDNGTPFASTGIHGLCELNVSWIQLGIRHQRSRPGCPQDNGAHERMHRDLKRQTTRPPARNLVAQQLAFDRFLDEYNLVRPHQALGGKTPATLWTPSPRHFPHRIAAPRYPGHYELRRVSNAGTFRFQRRQLFLSNALAQELIGLEEIDDGIWSIYYYDVLLARLDDRTFEIAA